MIIKRISSFLRKNEFIHLLLILVIGAISYLIFIRHLGLYGDDWYIIFDAHTQGSGFLKVVYSSDRPGRGYLLELIYRIFADNLLYYHLSAFMFRFLASMAFYWTLTMVWVKNKFWNFLMALFFMLYPGFLMQVQPVDYQSQICSLCLAMISIALTVKTIKTHFYLGKTVFFFLAVISGWVYLALVEYSIGMEFLRLFFIGCLTWREVNGKLGHNIIRLIFRWLPFATIPATFLVWRIFFFTSTRAATDISIQLGAFYASPLLVGSHWLVNALFGAFNTIVSAWILPFYNIVIMGGFRLRDNLLVIAVGIGVLIIMSLGIMADRKNLADQNEFPDYIWIRQALWGGLIAVFFGIIPIIITNRTVDFESSRYSLASAPGAVMLLVAGINFLKSHRIQMIATVLLTFLAVVTHTGNALNHVYQADSLRDFWWQVSWRAPSIEAGTNLVVSYSLMEAPEDYVIWGPANLIYYPEKQNTVPIKIKLPASLPNKETILNIIGGGNGRDRDRRGNFVHEDPRTILVMTQPTVNNCVRILDGSLPELSPQDSDGTILIASHSLIGNLNWSNTPLVLPSAIFGQEPQHTWCYYFEKAELAAQMRDWPTVIALGQEAMLKGYSPIDPIEWTPFLRALVATREMEALEPYHSIMNATPFIRNQTCQILKQTATETNSGDLELMDFIDSSFCALP